MKQLLEKIIPHLQDTDAFLPGKNVCLSDFICLHNNETPFGPSAKVKDILSNIDLYANRYPNDYAQDLKNKLSQRLNVAPLQITLGAGSSEILDMLMHLFLQPGDGIILNQHSYFLYRVLAKNLGAKINFVAEQDYRADLVAMANAVNENTKMIMLANPNNPFGQLCSEKEIETFFVSIPKHVAVVIDEAYFEFIHDTYKSAIHLIETHPNLIVTRTFSKAYGLAGLRIGYCISSKMIATKLAAIRKPFNVSTPALAAAAAALDDAKHLAMVLDNNQQQMQTLVAALKEREFPILSAVGNFITIDVNTAATELCTAMAQEGILIADLSNYGLPTCIRISIGTPLENETFLQKLTILQKRDA